MHIRALLQNHRILKLLWFVPLSAGILIYLLWLIAPYSFLMYLGILNLYFGFACLCMSLVYAGDEFIILIKKGAKKESLKMLFWMALSLLNLPIAALIFSSASEIMSRYHLTITNSSNSALTNCTLMGGGVNQTISAIKPKETIKRTLHFKQDDELKLSCTKDDQVFTQLVEGYVTHDMGGEKNLVIE